MAELAAKVLTVSDGVIAGTREDKSGDALVAALTDAGFTVVARQVASDGVESVSDALVALCDGFAGLVVTTGGTGFRPARSHTGRHTRGDRTRGAGAGGGHAPRQPSRSFVTRRRRARGGKRSS